MRRQLAEAGQAGQAGDAEERREGAARGGTGLVYHEDMLLHRNPWDPQHIECPERLAGVWARCGQLGLLERCTRLPARPATDAELLQVHTQQFIREVELSASRAAAEQEGECSRWDSVYLCAETERAARLAAGAAVDLVHAVLDVSTEH